MSAAQAKNFSSRTLAHWLALAFFVLALVAPMSLAALPTGPASASANSAISANNLLNMGANGISGLFDQGAAPFGMVSRIPYAAWSDNLIVANDSAHNVEMGLNNAGLTGLSLGTSAIPGMVGYAGNAGNLVDAGTVAAGNEIPLINGRFPINSQYAGGSYPLENLGQGLQARYPASVQFTPQGFPNFTPYAQAEVEITGLTGAYKTDEALANEAMGYPSTPAGYVWHHVEDGNTMQLIPEDIH
jgi:hypothetical protein